MGCLLDPIYLFRKVSRKFNLILVRVRLDSVDRWLTTKTTGGGGGGGSSHPAPDGWVAAADRRKKLTMMARGT